MIYGEPGVEITLSADNPLFKQMLIAHGVTVSEENGSTFLSKKANAPVPKIKFSLSVGDVSVDYLVDTRNARMDYIHDQMMISTSLYSKDEHGKFV